MLIFFISLYKYFKKKKKTQTFLEANIIGFIKYISKCDSLLQHHDIFTLKISQIRKLIL